MPHAGKPELDVEWAAGLSCGLDGAVGVVADVLAVDDSPAEVGGSFGLDADGGAVWWGRWPWCARVVEGEPGATGADDTTGVELVRAGGVVDFARDDGAVELGPDLGHRVAMPVDVATDA